MQNYLLSLQGTSKALLLAIAVLLPALADDTAQNSAGKQTLDDATVVVTALPDGVDTKTGFRMNRYRAPVPESNPGTEVVDTLRAFELHSSRGAIFIDVFPPAGLGADPLDGTWVTNETHNNIENSTWLPEVGRGFLEQGHIEYFQRNLALLTQGDKQTALLFYCTADCWQSWNAARRALLWGYGNIFWYPDGTDGWLEEGHSLVEATPVNFFGDE